MAPRGWVGDAISRTDAVDKVTGAAVYVGDVDLPNLLLAGVVRSPHASAAIERIDTSRAEQVPGVVSVLTGVDCDARYGLTLQDETVLARDVVRYVGEEVAAVAARTEEALEEALRLVEVHYAPLPAVTDPNEALDPTSPIVHEGDTSNVALEYHIDHGDVDEAFARAAVVVEGEFTTTSQHQVYVEPVGAVAHFTGGRLQVWAPVQDPFLLRAELAKVHGLPISAVRVIQPTVGGSYGGKLRHQKPPYLAALLAIRSAHPIKLVNRRHEEFTAGRPRVAATMHVQLAFDGDGTLLGKQARIVADNGAYTSYAAGPFAVMTIRSDNQYRIPNIRTDSYLVYTNTTPSGSFRGFGNMQMTFALESLVDDAARALGRDPIDLRIQNAVRAGDVTPFEWQIETDGLVECLQAVKAATDGWQVDSRSGRAIGYACGIHSSGNRTLAYDGSAVRLTLAEDGSVLLSTPEGELGQGGHTVMSQLIATVLEVDVSRIAVAVVDTDAVPFGLGPSADRSTLIAGHAVLDGARRLRQAICEAAAERWGVAVDQVRYADGFIEDVTAGTRWDLGTVAAESLWRLGGRVISETGTYDSLHTRLRDPQTLVGHTHPTHSFTAQAVEVDVDEETGEVRVVRMAAAQDVGRALNPSLVRGQIEGAVLTGIGFALHERPDGWSGAGATGLIDYGMPRSTDHVAVESIIIETEDPRGPMGAKGAGQPGTLLPAPAIANALADRHGIRLTDLPFTPERVVAALAAKETGS